MKILYTHLYDASFGMGGAEKVMLDIAVAAKSRGHHIQAAVNKSPLADQLQEEGINVTEIFWKKSKSLQTVLALKRICKEFSPELIHSHHRYTTFLADLFLKTQAPILHTEHVLRKDKKFFFRAGTKVTAVHESVAQNLHRFFHVPLEKIVTIPNAVKPSLPRTDILQSLRKKFPKNPGQFQILFIGRLEEQKGHIYLIEAVGLLSPHERKTLVFFLAGDGSLEESLKNRVQELQVENQFCFLGHTGQIPEYLHLCDFVVLPSLWEGMPLSVLEAFSAGKPVLATDIPGTRETMVDHVTGWLVPPKNAAALAEALRYILSHSHEISDRGTKAHELWRQKYSFEVLMDRYLEVYQDLKDAP